MTYLIYLITFENGKSYIGQTGRSLYKTRMTPERINKMIEGARNKGFDHVKRKRTLTERINYARAHFNKLLILFKNGQEIGSFLSPLECSIALNINRNSLVGAIHRRSITHKGYTFKVVNIIGI